MQLTDIFWLIEFYKGLFEKVGQFPLVAFLSQHLMDLLFVAHICKNH
jgi:hypothetical protein